MGDRAYIKFVIFLSTPSARRATVEPAIEVFNLPISIHALREEGDAGGRRAMRSGSRFLSTPSARRATAVLQPEPESLYISIHALREEGDHAIEIFPIAPFLFLSTPSARRATILTPSSSGVPSISIHALREEGDVQRADSLRRVPHFYPRPPRGGRHVILSPFTSCPLFLSTPSARRATPDA